MGSKRVFMGMGVECREKFTGDVAVLLRTLDVILNAGGVETDIPRTA